MAGTTATLQLIVKGPRKTALRAAARRGIAVVSARGTTYGETHLRVACKGGAGKRVNAWFYEETPRGARGLNPPGTLLHLTGRCPR